MPAVFTTLVLTEKALLPHDVERIRQFHPDQETVHVHVCVPQGEEQGALSEADELVDDVARADFAELKEDAGAQPASGPAAADALRSSVSALSGGSLTADGELVPANPVDAVVAKAIELDVDEIIVVTEPHWLEEVLRRDWGTRIFREVKHRHREIPVLHFIAGTDQIVR